MMDETQPFKVLTADIVAAYVSANKVAVGDIPSLIASVYEALSGAGQPGSAEPPKPAGPTAAQIRRSIRPDGLVSFEDGRAYKTLKRHLATKGLTIDEYKAKWGLPADYPTTAPDYSARRSEMAKSLGLGTKTGRPRGKPARKR